MCKVFIKILFRNLVLVWCMFFYYYAHTYVEHFFFDKFNVIATSLNNLYACCPQLQVVTSLTVVASWVILVIQTYRSRGFAFKRVVADFLGIEILLLVQQEWITPCSGFGTVRLYSLVAIILFLDVMYCGLRYLAYQDVRSFTDTKQAFYVEDYDIKKIDDVRRRYLESLVCRLEAVNNNEESFVVAVYGIWGSGKTMFIRCLEDCLNGRKAVVINFNPWDCHSPKLMLNSFFEILQKALVDYDSSLTKSIIKYTELLTSLDLPKPFGYLTSLFEQENGIDNIKTKIKDALRKLQLNVYVLIDDVDRLTKEELIEVIRLVRNTANFPYLKFVVACDRNYIVSQLREIGVMDSYLQKIFSLDLTLPSMYDDYPCVNKCREAIWKMTDDIHLLNYFDTMLPNTSALLENVLGNLRQADRFARQLVLNWSFARINVGGKQTEIVVSEFVLLELLKITDSDLYFNLHKCPDLFFEVKKNHKYSQNMYVLKKIDELPKIHNNVSSSLMQHLFSYDTYANVSHNSIVLLENYDKYFSFGKVYGHITKTDFMTLLNVDGDTASLEKRINDLSVSELSSIYNMILMLDVSKMRLAQKKRVIDVVMLMSVTCEIERYRYLIENTMLKILTYGNDKIAIRKYLLERMDNTDGKYRSMISSNIICNVILKHYIECGEEILPETELNKIVIANFNNFVSTKQCDASDVLKDNTLIHQLVKESVVCYPVFDDDGIYECDGYMDMIHRELVGYFEQHKSSRVDVVYDFEKIEVEAGIPQDYYDDIKNKKECEILELFGSNNNYKEFKEKCFDTRII